MTSHLWHDDRDTVNSVAAWAVDTSQITTLDELLTFFEKPWNHDELWSGWLEDIDSHI